MLHIFTARVSELELESLEKLDSEVLKPTLVDLQSSWKVIPVYAFLQGSFAGSSEKQVVKFTLVGRELKTWLSTLDVTRYLAVQLGDLSSEARRAEGEASAKADRSELFPLGLRMRSVPFTCN